MMATRETGTRDEVAGGTDVPTGKSVLLFSGGMDSLMAAKLLQPDVVLYVMHRSRYEAEEVAALHRLVESGALRPSVFEWSSLDGLGAFARPDAIIPMRNLFFLALAAQYGERLYIGAMDGDRSLDKAPHFFGLVEEMFSYLYQEQHWCTGRRFEVLAPFRAETKTSLVRKYLGAGHPAALLLESFSCYAPVDARACGTCKPCFRKWVALENNGVPTAGLFVADPWTAGWLPACWPLVRAGTYRGAEDADWVAALARKGVSL